AAVHHHLVRAGTRLRTGLVIESGEPRDIHHMATLIGYGASAINPYLMFEAVGLEPDLIDKHFTGTASRIGGVGLEVLCTEALERHFRAYPKTARDLLPVGGVLQWRRDGELHMWNPDTIAKLQHAVGAPAPPDPAVGESPQQVYAEFARLANQETTQKATLRGLMKLREAPEPLALDEVESAVDIVKRFS